MNRLVGLGRFAWSFIVGDDWRVAVGVALAIGVTAIAAAWWILPLAVAALLSLSVLKR
jgi:hypothetical protein